MGSTGSTPQASTTTIPTVNEENLGRLREESFRKKAREDIASALNAIEGKAEALLEPLDPSRPYGLPKELEENPGHIWQMVFDHVNDLDTIESLRHVCELFRDILERKYVAARLPEIISHCLQRKVIPTNAGGRTGTNRWLETMTSLRILSTATKFSVDDLFFNRGMLKKDNWFSTRRPYFSTDEGKMPILRLGALNTEAVRLQKALEFPETLPLRALIFDERQTHEDEDDDDDDDEDDADLPAIRSSFHKLLKKIGGKITSFRYTSNENPLNTYNNLRSWVFSMPNLVELIVEFNGPNAATHYQSVGSFPTLPKLKRYAEGPEGFGIPYIGEIFKANPTIEEVLVGQAISFNNEVNKMIHALDSLLQLKKFHCTCEPSIALLEHQFPWASELTTLSLWDINPYSKKISCGRLFQFITSFRKLRSLTVCVQNIQIDGLYYVNLPELKKVKWKVNLNFKPLTSNLEFIKLAEGLEQLDLDLSRSDIKSMEKILKFLEGSRIPSLFPALEVVNVKTGNSASAEYKAVWKKIA